MMKEEGVLGSFFVKRTSRKDSGKRRTKTSLFSYKEKAKDYLRDVIQTF